MIEDKRISSEEIKKLNWQFALENSNIGLWDFNAELNRVFFSNESKKIIGFTDEDFGSNPSDWNDRVHPDDREKYYNDFKEHLNGNKAIYKNVHRVKCKDGTYKWILDKGKIIEWSKNGDPKRVIGTHSDITEQKRKEKKALNGLSIISDQNKKLKEFAHIVSHNLKLHSGNFESLLLLLDESKTNEQKHEIIDYLNTLSSTLSKTIQDLNQIVSVQSNKDKSIEKLYIKEEINKTLKNVDYLIQEGKATIINNVHEKLYLYFNASYLESITQNLLTNAIKYKHPDRDPIITIESSLTEHQVILTIADNGSGIDLNKFGSSIFKLYKTFHMNDDAEGVGLYLVKNQIESFGGDIGVSSEVGVGTTFSIIIPDKKNPA